MGYALTLAPAVSPDAQRAIDYLGIENPVDWLKDFDVDVDALRAFAENLRGQASACESSGSGLRAATIAEWTGQAAIAYDDCRMQWWDYILLVADWLLFIVDCIVTIVDWIVELIRWVASLVDWLLGLLSVFGGILWLLDHWKIKPPGWVRWLLKLGKLVEKGPKLIITLIAIAAWLLAQFGWVIDWLLDKLREGIAWVRKWIDICIKAPDAWPDEPIEPAF